MSTEAAECVDLGLHRNFFTMDADKLFPFNQPTSERAVALVTDDEHVGIWFPKILLQMMQDSSRVAHARSGHDQTRSGDIVYFHRIFGRNAEFHRLEVGA